MAQNIPFFFGGGAQQQQNAASGQPPRHQTPAAMPPPASNGTPALPPQAQQMAFQQNGALPAIPGMDPNLNAALRNITPEQLALIAQLFQAGALPLPPQAPGAPTATPLPAPAPISTQPAIQAPVPTPAATAAHSAPQKQVEGVDMDKEEGEVEEGEEESANTPRDFVLTPPRGPRVSTSETARRPSQQVPGTVRQLLRQANGVTKARIGPSKEAAISTFILEMHKAGYTFDQLAKEVSSPKALRAVYQKLNLPVNPVNGTPLAAPQSNTQPAPAADERKALTNKRPPPTKALGAQDRSAYLARLEAAKKKKPDASVHSPTPPKPTVNTAIPPKPEVSAAVSASPQPVAPSPGPTKIKVKTELVKQRLEALKAKEAAKKNAEALSDGTQPSSPSTKLPVAENSIQKTLAKVGLGDGLVEAAAQASRNAMPSNSSPMRFSVPAPISLPQSPAVPTAASPTLNRGFGLPGLFTTGMPQSPQSPAATHSRAVIPPRPHSSLSTVQPSIQPEMRPSSTMPPQSTYNNFPSNGLNPTQRPFGYDQTATAQEPFIITDSDDESDVEMEIDDNSDQKSAISSMKQDLARAVGSLQDISSKANLQKSATSSAPGTPMTPGGDLYQRKLEEIEEMNRRIAERQRRMNQNKAKSAAQAQVASGQATPLSAGATPVAEVTVNPISVTVLENQPPSAVDALVNGVEPVVEDSLMAGDKSLETTAENEEDSFDDADLYDEEAGVELPAAVDDDKVGSQATTVTGAAQFQPVEVVPVEEDVAMSGHPQAVHPPHEELERHEEATTASLGAIAADYDDDIDDDDLDDIYGTSTVSRPAGIQAEPPTQQELDHEDDEDEEEDDSDDAMDTSDASSDSDEDEDSDDGSADSSNDEADDAMSVSDDTNNTDQPAATLLRADMAAANDSAPELQPSEEELGVPSEEPPQSRSAFTPYHSPLSAFKDFRYHPDFLQDVPGGFKSITYSHKIDPNTTLCLFETTGGICNDKTCPHQHFRSMALSDNDLLKFMGTGKLPVNSPEEDQKWKAGLTNVVKELRKKGQQQDVSAIARAIAEYRREFIGDPTKTLVLE